MLSEIINLKNLKHTIAFLNHNKKFFVKQKYNLKKKILVEFNSLCDSHIVYSYLANILAKKYDAQIISYQPKFKNNNFKSLVSGVIKKIIDIQEVIYSSFGSQNTIYPEKKINKKIEYLFVDKIKNIKSKNDIYKINCENINIGDLIYDGYLRKNNVPTIDIKSKLFQVYLKDFLYLFYFWNEYFKKNKIKSLIASHTVYEFGIPLRIAISKKIDVFTAGSFFIFRHSKKNKTIFDMKYYHKYFRKKKGKIKILENAKKYVQLKFKGFSTIENKVSALPKDNLFAKVKYSKKILKQNGKKNILIAAHHFSDAPNAFGRFLFNDFYEWIDYLGLKSNNSKHNWYIKFHPSEFESNKETANFFLNKYKNLKLIPNHIKHSQLIHEGIDLVLTVYGTIGFEYAFFGVPVINAGKNNPHISYKFNYHPSNISDYNNAIQNFKKLKLNFNKNFFYEYFHMRYLDGFYLFNDEVDNANSHEQYNYHSPEIYKKWLENFNLEKDKQLKKHILNFINSNEFRCKKMV